MAASSPRPQQQQQQHPSAAADCQRRCPLSRPPATVCAVSGLTLSPSPPPPLRFLLIIKSVSLPSLLCSPPPPPLRSNPQLNTVCEMLYCASSGRLSLRIHFCSASVTSTAENNHPLFLTLYLYISYPSTCSSSLHLTVLEGVCVFLLRQPTSASHGAHCHGPA